MKSQAIEVVEMRFFETPMKLNVIHIFNEEVMMSRASRSNGIFVDKGWHQPPWPWPTLVPIEWPTTNLETHETTSRVCQSLTQMNKQMS